MDILFRTENGRFNYRVAFVISDDNCERFLIHTIKGFDFWLFPGGRGQIGEFSNETISRELKEELGDINIKKIKAVAFAENIFDFKGKTHEISLFYHVSVCEDSTILSKEGVFEGKEGEKYLYKWVTLQELESVKLQPAFALDILKNIVNKDSPQDNTLKHYILDER
ncbi:MAG: NUDIX domain-containing protein [Proteobacteria bacterium]|nr:NUDIX domain-containing protein [Pseudomonadota bacterium]